MYYLHLIPQKLFEINTAIHVVTCSYLDSFLNAIWFRGIQTLFKFKNVETMCFSIFNISDSFVGMSHQIVNRWQTIKKRRKKKTSYCSHKFSLVLVHMCYIGKSVIQILFLFLLKLIMNISVRCFICSK